jgi:hypothetical protein
VDVTGDKETYAAEVFVKGIGERARAERGESQSGSFTKECCEEYEECWEKCAEKVPGNSARE